MSTHNVCFCGEIRKIFPRYPPLSRPMSTAMMNKQENTNIFFLAFFFLHSKKYVLVYL